MSTWIVPYVDQELAFWQEVEARFGDQIKEVYFPVPGGQFASGRSPQPEEHLDAFLRAAPLPKAAVVNAIVLPRPVEAMAPEVVAVLRQLQDDFGVQGVTVSNLDLARAIKEALPGLAVAASVLAGISSPVQALIAGEWVDAIGPDTRLVRDLAGLKRMRAAYGGEIRLLVNEACLPGCLFRIQHFYEMGYGQEYPQSLCQGVLEARPWLRLTGAWILPRHLHYYDGLYDSLKLAGRVTLRDPARYLAVLDAYVERASILPRDIGGGPASPLNGIDVSDEWFEFVLHCDKRCDTCSVCREQYRKFSRS
jgi:collagenase-like PrtC family protease